MILTDSHCHLTMSSEPDAVLARARQEGVRGFVVPATRLDDAPAAVELAQRHEDVWAAVGFHPHEAKDFDAHATEQIQRLAEAPRVVAIGEIGLDYHYDHSPREVQRRVLERQIEIARQRNLPIILHNRESTEDLVGILRAASSAGVGGVIHSFTETYEVARTLIDLGFWISFSGILTFRTAESLRDVARRLPPDRVLIETDTPYLAPVPHRGKENEPRFVARIAELLAALWDRPAAEVGEMTTKSFESLFRVEVPR
ncbi:MAG TPA: TatD family hydrolase [Thermoanaerobaculia bacterium]|nr:TatD family hydrolase [Thermoanaerobaculia bacterium]